jgi:16S rRNA processing protein RimM
MGRSIGRCHGCTFNIGTAMNIEKTPKDHILLARIGAAHGIKGGVKLQIFSDTLLTYPLCYADGVVVKLTRLQGDIAFLDGVHTRTIAESLRGKGLYTQRTALPEPEDDTYYIADLIGLEARSPAGDKIGTVIAHHDYGAGAILEIEYTSGKTDFVPFKDGFVGVVDIKGGFCEIVV